MGFQRKQQKEHSDKITFWAKKSKKGDEYFTAWFDMDEFEKNMREIKRQQVSNGKVERIKLVLFPTTRTAKTKDGETNVMDMLLESVELDKK